MSYFKGMGADTSHGPGWYRAMGSVASRPMGTRVPRGFGAVPAPIAKAAVARAKRVQRRQFGSLGDDTASQPGDLMTGTLQTPTVTDPTVAFQTEVLKQLQAGVATMKTAELQKWLQIAATLSIPLAAAIWRVIFRRGGSSSGDPTL